MVSLSKKNLVCTIISIKALEKLLVPYMAFRFSVRNDFLAKMIFGFSAFLAKMIFGFSDFRPFWQKIPLDDWIYLKFCLFWIYQSKEEVLYHRNFKLYNLIFQFIEAEWTKNNLYGRSGQIGKHLKGILWPGLWSKDHSSIK